MILTGWKEIADHLRRSLRTVQRWEMGGLPVRRLSYEIRSPVIAESDELDTWLRNGHLPAMGRPPVVKLIAESQARRHAIARSRVELHQNMAALMQRFAKLKNKLGREGKMKDLNRGAATNFLRIEIESARTFCRVAEQSTRNPERRSRNLGKARKAYEALVHFKDRATLTEDEAKLIAKEIQKLAEELRRVEMLVMSNQ